MNTNESYNIHLDFKIQRFNFEDNLYHNEYNFDVILDEDDEEKVIGKGRVFLYLTNKMFDDGLGWIDFDDIFGDNNHVDFLEELFEGDQYGSVRLKEHYYYKILDQCSSCNILIPDRLEIYPEYRNKGYGKIVTKMIRDMFYDSYGIEIIKAFPLQFESKNAHGIVPEIYEKMRYDLMEQDEDTAQQSLYRMYTSKGYKQIEYTNLFYYYPEN